MKLTTRLLGAVLALSILSAPAVAEKGRYALALHGGAGADPAKMAPEEKSGTEATLRKALRHGLERLKAGAASMDVCEEVVKILEDDPWFNAGRGAALNEDGEAELDAAIMDGSSLACGAVAGVRRVKNPISLARLVLARTPHVLLVGAGADRFGEEQGQVMVDPTYFVTERMQQALEGKRRKSRGTVGCVALDEQGNLCAATSTGGLTGKKAGRVGDSPIIGAGTYADNRTCAVSCTGVGEEFIRHGVAGQVAARMRFAKSSLSEAVDGVFRESLGPDIGGLIAVDRAGNLVLHFNTPGMSRGAADWKGRFETGIGP